MIKVIGLGPGDFKALTIGVVEELKKCDNVFLRTEKHPTVDYLRELGIEFTTYDSIYDNSNNFDDVYRSIAEDLIEKYRKSNELIYAVPGHPLVAEKSVFILKDMCKEQNIDIEIMPAVSFIDVVMERLNIDPIDGLKVIDAFDIKDQIMDKRIGTIITQVYNKYIASEVKLALLEHYKDDTEIYFVRAAGIKEIESIRKIYLYEIDRQEDIDYLTSLYIPKDLDNNKDFYDLIQIMDRLRGQDGCPWDREQTHDSLKKYLVEESYEVIEAIEENDDNKIVEELGDVLLQVVFHAAIGKEEGYFNINDIISAICNKMIHRHPHVFDLINVKDSDEVLVNWDIIKKKEKGMKTYTEEMEHIAKSLPALIRAEKIQNKAKKVGFDFNNVEDALKKVFEEINEVNDVYNGGNKERIIEELGDLLFSVVNITRFLNIDAEEALNNANNKFIKRFSYIEKSATSRGILLEDMSIDEMDELWSDSKK